MFEDLHSLVEGHEDDIELIFSIKEVRGALDANPDLLVQNLAVDVLKLVGKLVDLLLVIGVLSQDQREASALRKINKKTEKI